MFDDICETHGPDAAIPDRSNFIESVLPNVANGGTCMALFGQRSLKSCSHQWTQDLIHKLQEFKTKMSGVDAVSIFAEGTYEEQVSDLSILDLD